MRMQTSFVGLALLTIISLILSACSAQRGVGAVASALAAAPATCSGNWEVATSPNVGGQDNVLAAVAGAASDDVWAVGQYAPDANPNITLSLALHYDGTTWSTVDTPNIGTHANALLSVAAQPGAAWAVGYHIGDAFLARSLVEAWDGHAWRVVDVPHPFETENLYGVAASAATDVWAVGSGRDGEGHFATLALHFDGKSWSVVPTANPGARGNVLYAVIALAANDAWAVGQKLGHSGPDQSLIEHWDGCRWSEVPAQLADAASTQLIAVAAAHDDIRAVGDAQDGIKSLRTFAAASESARFAIQPTVNPSDGDNRLAGIVAPTDDDTWAVGAYLDTSAGNQRTLVLHGAEGAAWTQVPSPSPSASGDSLLAAIADVAGRDLWAVGAFDGDNAKQTLVLHRCQ
jgi:hypothetical protein